MKNRAIVCLLTGMVAAHILFMSGCGMEAGEKGMRADGLSEQEAEGSGDVMEEWQEETDAAPMEAGMRTEGMEEDAGEGAEAETAGEQMEDKPETVYEDGANGFAFRFTKEMLGQKAEGENLIVSPYSVWLPLAALVNGADEEARAALLSAIGRAGVEESVLNGDVREMLSALRHDEQAEWNRENGLGEYESPLQIANALFIDKYSQVNPEFEAIFEEEYGGKLFSVDFLDSSSVEEVNRWAEESTRGKIDRIVDSFSGDTVAAIANAIYFSDGWTKEFTEQNTAEDIFYGAAGEERVPFMNQEFDRMPYYEDADMQAAALRTATGGRLILLLPREGVDAEALLADMDVDKFARLEEMEERMVQLSLPRFQIESDVFSLKEVLMRMGVPLMDSMHPHLDGILEGEALFISEAVQKAMLEVDEKGMTAAAVTAIMMDRCSLIIGGEPIEMKCDRPFAFLLTAYADEGQQILFTGVVNRI